LITPKEAVLFDPPYSYYRYHWFYSYGFSVEFTEEELQEVSEDLRDLFEGPIKARKASLYDKLNQLTRDLSLHPYHFWNKDLTLGSSGEEVKALQKILINDGLWDSDQKATGYFGPVTKDALAKFQEKYLGFSSGTGYFDRETREYFKQLSIKLWGRIIYVDADANGANDGSSWSHAYNDLQDALAAASILDEIRVAAGIYKPDQGTGVTSGDREATFQLINGVTLKGGYAGFDEPDPNTRDIELYETILSGDLNGNDVDVNDPRELLDEPSRAENSYNVVTASGTDATAVIDGFTITGGNANGSYPKYQGGGLYNTSGSPTMNNCTFAGNSASGFGGGMYNDQSSMMLTDCIFVGNLAYNGGGMYNQHSSMILTSCSFVSNLAGFRGGGIENYGSSLTLFNSTFSGNSADVSGGGMACDPLNGTLTNCVFAGNLARYGGGICGMSVYPMKVTNCTFSGNSAKDRGGGLHISMPPGPCGGMNSEASYGRCTITNCVLWADTPEEIYDDGDYAIITYSAVQGSWSGEGNINTDPCFADANNDDYHLKSQAGRWNPNAQSCVQDEVTSPCIVAGDPLSPIGNEPFPNGGRINMGAYGGTIEASKSYFGQPVCEIIIAGDINGDCKVNFLDFRLMALHWLTDNSP